MREKLITLSYIFNGDVLKIEEAIKCNIEIVVNSEFIKYIEKLGIVVITILDRDYPNTLRELYNPPYVIYCLGNTKLLNHKMNAIIGSRKCLQYSKDVCEELVKQLDCDVVVSGLAIGIDSFAHHFAIKYNKYTIAVLGSGFNKIYPYSNISLASQIRDNHLLVSEYPPNVVANKFHFPLRNRIIAALSCDLYVIEAASKSGSLITANIALELGRNIYCAPGNVFEKNYQGSHQLINDGAYLLELEKGIDL